MKTSVQSLESKFLRSLVWWCGFVIAELERQRQASPWGLYSYSELMGDPGSKNKPMLSCNI